ncbi:MAG: hypothetical protein QNK36_06475 [Colwellia sp.]|nr:hypothetical protein [Colwellia sp.]
MIEEKYFTNVQGFNIIRDEYVESIEKENKKLKAFKDEIDMQHSSLAWHRVANRETELEQLKKDLALAREENDEKYKEMVRLQNCNLKWSKDLALARKDIEELIELGTDQAVTERTLKLQKDLALEKELFKIKQDDWLEVCKENDQLHKILSLAREQLKEFTDIGDMEWIYEEVYNHFKDAYFRYEKQIDKKDGE